MAVCSSAYHTLMLDSEGNVWACGYNEDLQLGLPKRNPNETNPKVTTPEKISSIEEICSISCGRYHSACVDRSGNLYMFGQSTRNQFIGVGSIPTKIDFGDTFITSVHCGTYHTICIDSLFNVYSFGGNDYGELGLGGRVASKIPKQITTLTNIHYAACGGYHSLFLSFEGDVYACGNNSRGQLGIDSFDEQVFPVKIANLQECVSIACGTYFSIVLTSDGDVYSFGDNVSGQLGIGNDRTNVTVPKQAAVDVDYPIFAISCGNYHSAFLETGGRLWVCGENTSGQLGLPQLENIKTLSVYPHSKDVYVVACGGSHMIVKTQEGVMVHGNNKHGQLGIGDNLTTNVSGKMSNPDIIGDYSTSRSVRAKSARK
mmetsp:Transcript_2829/g.4616  ORF Transcript_2829/g.4616 Transcript_2829/m.4616 type:complete len:372 (-) Transcript_2829:25-1140(-)